MRLQTSPFTRIAVRFIVPRMSSGRFQGTGQIADCNAAAKKKEKANDLTHPDRASAPGKARSRSQ